MKKIVILLMLLPFSILKAQNIYPEFATTDMEIKIPSHLPGIKPDMAVNGFITYRIKGQIFVAGQNNVIQEAPAFSGKSDKATPYQTLTELVNVVRKSDWKGMKDLYVKASAKELDNLIPADKRGEYFTSLNQNKLIKIVAGFEYRNGFMVFIENPDQSVNTAFFVKDGKKYMMQRLVDSSAQLWNMALYFRFKPQPVKAANLTSQLDSVPLNGEQKLVFTLSKPGNWVLLYKQQEGSPVIVRVQDGDPDMDNDQQPGRIEVRMTKNNFSGTKVYEIMATETNYPVYMVNSDLLNNAVKVVFKVY